MSHAEDADFNDPVERHEQHERDDQQGRRSHQLQAFLHPFDVLILARPGDRIAGRQLHLLRNRPARFINVAAQIPAGDVDEDEPLSESVKKKVKTTLDDALKVLKFAKKSKYSKVSFGVFQLVYFEIMAKGGRIIDFDKFSRLLWTANAKLDRKYDDSSFSIMSVKKAFAKGAEQSELAKEYIKEMGDLEGVVNFSPRTASLTQKYNELAEKGFLDADGNVLEMKDAEWSHLIPHAEGGTEAIMERKSLNHIIPTYDQLMYNHIFLQFFFEVFQFLHLQTLLFLHF